MEEEMKKGLLVFTVFCLMMGTAGYANAAASSAGTEKGFIAAKAQSNTIQSNFSMPVTMENSSKKPCCDPTGTGTSTLISSAKRPCCGPNGTGTTVLTS